MRKLWWLACFSLIAACQFGDDLARRSGPDAGTGRDGSVMPPTDAAAVVDAPTVTACTLVPQGGCSGTTPACDIHDDGMTFCRAITSQGTSNNHCTIETECKDGYSCVSDDDPTHVPVCARFCKVDADCTGTGSRCVNDLVSTSTSGVRVCTNACMPAAQTGCPSGMGCLPVEDGNNDFTDCTYMGTKALGVTCNYSEECSPGTACTGNTTAGYTCKQLCVLGTACPLTSQTCTGFTTPLTVGSATYGVCR